MNIVIGICGASGAIYAKLLLDKLRSNQDRFNSVAIVASDTSLKVWQHELDSDFDPHPFNIYDPNDFSAPFASGSSKFDTMIICPCSMGTMGRIASGIANDLMTRAADMMLKERRKLILVARETPFSLIHINNMKTITEAGGIICPAIPSYYSRPSTIEDLAATVVDRALALAGLDVQQFRWGGVD